MTWLTWSSRRCLSSLMVSASNHHHHGCRHLSRATAAFASWKNFSLDDELTKEVKESIEKKWSSRVYGTECPAERSKKLNTPNKQSTKYILPMFPYPSGRLHLGHVRVYTLSDVLARYHRMQGHTVIHPMGWDAFGLPAENAAREHSIDAKEWTLENIQNMKKQIMDMGCCFDWDREFATCDPSYFKWTQWLFTQLWKKGLAYKKYAYVYWDPIDKTVLAEEQVDSEMRSWRSGAKVEKKLLKQWFIKTAVFADKLSEALQDGSLKHGWRDVVKLQNHWIGDVKGYFTDASVDIRDIFEDESSSSASLKEPIRIWFSNLEALKNAKYFILNDNHFLSRDPKNILYKTPAGFNILKMSIKNPATGNLLPVISFSEMSPEEKPWVPESCDCRTDEILSSDDISNVVNENERKWVELEVCSGEVICDGESSVAEDGMKEGVDYFPASLRLRDWLVSRQRNWGTPIPAYTCQKCGHHSVISDDQLPMLQKTSEGQNTPHCSSCDSTNVTMETDTLDTFFDSSWYFFRFLDSANGNAIYDPEEIKCLPVHTYIGGKEHATLHLYYARFMTQFLHSMGMSPVTEPFEKLIPIGMVLGEAHIVKGSGKYVEKKDCESREDKLIYSKTGEAVYKNWEKMSKSRFNGTDPSTVLEEFGIDTTRLLTMAEAAPTSPRKWPPNNPEAYTNWQSKMWGLVRRYVDAKDFGDLVFMEDDVWKKSETEIFDARNYHLKGINHNYSDTSQLSVVISKLQAMFGYLRKVPKTHLKESLEFERALGAGLICIYPIMPAFSAQLWQSFRDVASFTEPEFNLDNEVWEQHWPTVDWRYALDLVCQVKGKSKPEEVITKIERNYLDTMDEATAVQVALDLPAIQKLIPSGEYEVLHYNVEPGYRAILGLREKQVPNTSGDDKNNAIADDKNNNKNAASDMKV